MEPLEKAARRLRAAVSTERFPAIPDLAADYVELTIEQARSLAPGSPEAARLQAEAGELLEWSRRTILAQKAHLGAKVEALEPLVAYLRGEQGSRTTWQTEG